MLRRKNFQVGDDYILATDNNIRRYRRNDKNKCNYCIYIPIIFIIIGISFTLFIVWFNHNDVDDNIINDHQNHQINYKNHKLDLHLSEHKDTLNEMNQIIDDKLKYIIPHIYIAGLPRFPRVFFRDSIISALIYKGEDSSERLEAMLILAAKLQGKSNNPVTGEEVGKIFHEYPSVNLNGLSTLYSACDTTAWYLIAMARWMDDIDVCINRKFKSVAPYHVESIQRAYTYILNHVSKEYLFIEDPKKLNAKAFALKVTYWKDSIIPQRANGQPNYPITYTLVHTMYIAALRAYSKIVKCLPIVLKHGDVALDLSNKMLDSLKLNLWNENTGHFYQLMDRDGKIDQVTSDMLQMLYFLEPNDLELKYINGIVNSVKILESDYGFFTSSNKNNENFDIIYHQHSIWPFEQAIIHRAASKFKSKYKDQAKYIQQVSERIRPALLTASEHQLAFELYSIDSNKQWKPNGCHVQLWTQAASSYFASIKTTSSIFRNTQYCLNNSKWLLRGVSPSRVLHYCKNEKKELYPKISKSILNRRLYESHKVHYPIKNKKDGILSMLFSKKKKINTKTLANSTSGISFECLKGDRIIPIEWVNDNFCDCDEDGSDEPGTSACSHLSTSKFVCGHIDNLDIISNNRQIISSSMVDDGICDCCDGTDELMVTCPNKCEKKII